MAYHLAYKCDSQLAKELVRLRATPSVPLAFISDSESDEDDDEHVKNQDIGFQIALARLGAGMYLCVYAFTYTGAYTSYFDFHYL